MTDCFKDTNRILMILNYIKWFQLNTMKTKAWQIIRLAMPWSLMFSDLVLYI
jgi:hypothetical protein